MQISDEMVRAAWEAYQNTPIDLLADSDDETKRCVVNAIEAALSAMWRPIEEAPKDGTPILGYWLPITSADAQNAGQAFGVVIWEKGTWCNPDNTDDDYRDPSMWMPLPSPPKMEG